MLQITSTMVMCTFLSAPVMFVSAQMSLLDYNSQTAINFKGVLKDAMFDVSGTSFPFGVSISRHSLLQGAQPSVYYPCLHILYYFSKENDSMCTVQVIS